VALMTSIMANLKGVLRRKGTPLLIFFVLLLVVALGNGVTYFTSQKCIAFSFRGPATVTCSPGGTENGTAAEPQKPKSQEPDPKEPKPKKPVTRREHVLGELEGLPRVNATVYTGSYREAIVRSSPFPGDLSQPGKGTLGNGAPVTVYCQTEGQRVTNSRGTSTVLWDLVGIDKAGNLEWLAATLVQAGSDGHVVHRCPDDLIKE
jgi:hypothetical protein